jgi:ubiquinone/menaquinone biosynthesis C-methylase UbiE
MSRVFTLCVCISILICDAYQLHAQIPANAQNNMYRGAIDTWVGRLEDPERNKYQKPEEIIAYLGSLKGKTVYDLGAGTGYFSVRFARHGAKVIAAEVEPGFLSYIRKRLPSEKLDTGRLALRLVPFDNPGLKSAEADIVFIANTYHHLDHKVDYLKLIKKGLKPNGELVIIAFFKRNDITFGPPMAVKQTEDEIKKELEQAGFHHTEINTTLLPYQFIIKSRIK